MLFNSFPFVFGFLPAVLAGFFILGRSSRRVAAAALVLASLFFYAWWNAAYVMLLLGSAALNFAAGAALARRPSRALLGLAIAVDLLLLGYYKYADFFIGTVNAVAGATYPFMHIVLPIGISFFTFTQIAYLVDAYRGAARDYDFVHYLLFVSYFPHLIAGPLLHHSQMMPQFDDPKTYRPRVENIEAGLVLFALGLFKKSVLADDIAAFASPLFRAAEGGAQPAAAAAWIGCIAYALQLYFDFSGYSDMALGMSRMMNVSLPVNFMSPYRAADIIEFWRRWHMTLSSFLRDYLYIPLGGNRHGRPRRYANLMVTMVLGGLWHGASWTFVAWGALHGAYLVVNHAWRALRERLGLPGLPYPVSVALTFACVVVAWVPFRAADMAATWRIWRGMAGLAGWGAPPPNFWPPLISLLVEPRMSSGAWLALGLLVVFAAPNAYQLLARYFDRPASVSREMRAASWLAAGVGVLFFFALKALATPLPSPFLYFQF